MVLNGSVPRLPSWLKKRRIPFRLLRAGQTRIVGALDRLERVSRPRWSGVTERTRLLGGVCLLLALIIALPIPFGNMLPALCIVGIAVGMLQRDGVIVTASAAFGCLLVAALAAGLTFVSMAVFTAAQAAI